MVQPALAGQFVWHVTSPQGRVFYLVGSVHALPPEAYPLAPAYDRAYADSDSLIFETDLRALGRQFSQVYERAAYPPGESLEQHLPPDTYALLAGLLPLWRLSMDDMKYWRPWFLSSQIAWAKLSTSGSSLAYGLESHFIELAEADGKRVGGLVPVADHLALFRDFDGDDGIASLQAALNKIDLFAEPEPDSYALWKAGDLDGMAAMMVRQRQEEPEHFEQLLAVRNHAWIEPLETLLKENEKMMLIVGAGHTVGPESLNSLLESRGYTLKQLD